jgi:hypothetical protein
MINYRWTISRIDGFQEHPQLTLQDVVAEVYWELEIRDSEDYSVHYLRSMTQLPDPTPDDYTDFLELDSTDVLQWVWNLVGKEAMEQQLLDELNDMRAPRSRKLGTLPMPWMTSCCADGQNVQAASFNSTGGMPPGFAPSDAP